MWFQAVSLYRYRTVVLKGHPSPSFVINVHSLVTFIFIIYAFLNYPFGQNNKNDVCYTLRFSNGMELVKVGFRNKSSKVKLTVPWVTVASVSGTVSWVTVVPSVATVVESSVTVATVSDTVYWVTGTPGIFSTLLFNFAAIIVNCVILRFVKHFENIQSKRVQLTQSLLIQSIIPVLVSLPLLLLSFEFYFGIPMPASFGSTWYALTFLGPFLMPLSSILGIKSTRKELLDTMLCGCFPRPSVGNNQIKSAVTVILASRMERSTFTVRDDD
ncbi:hypothetical protein B9Z55_001152 [Caenorhabditis nigoni]|uniref:Uncharacterized protein n=1 Tax=Caenorhabditis nigoni TaxID=1611254 RepID=A0A2G5VEC6_9PELO|nr:hypothetical protein B9Z55_001152 [Caenorhabditis nigoni]